MKTPFLVMAVFSAALCLSACMGTDGPDTTEVAGRSRMIGTYTVDGGTLRVITSIYSNSYCVDLELETDIDSPFTLDKAFVLSGNSLTLITIDTIYSETFEYYDGPEASRPILAILQTLSQLSRVGEGSNLDGTWQSIETSLKVVSGTLSEKYMDGRRNPIQAQLELDKIRKPYLKFQSGKLYYIEAGSQAEIWVANWKGVRFTDTSWANSNRYSVDAKVLDAQRVQLKGIISGETVTLTLSGNGDVTYSSDDANRKPYLELRNPISCGQEGSTDWYPDFLAKNLRSQVDTARKTGLESGFLFRLRR